MDKDFRQELGISDLQKDCYLRLVQGGPMTTALLAEKLKQKRTTVHMALDKLAELGLVIKAASSKNWQAENPVALKTLLNQRQEQVRRSVASLQASLPSLVTRFRLSHQQPGVVHIEGLNGIKQLYDEIIRIGKEVLILPSEHDRDNARTAQAIDAQILRQQLAGISVRAIYPLPQSTEDDLGTLQKKGVSIRHFGEQVFEAQTIVFGDNVALSTFKESMYTTIITSPEIAQSYRSIFENMWQAAGEG
jgi:sugar-specific transcriptional regulator TrmB